MERILRVTAVMGFSSLLTVGLGAVRYKFIATELGAQGVGLLGILVSAIAFGAVFFSLGLNTSGVQAIAAAGADQLQDQRAKSALLHGTRWLGATGGLVVTLLGLTQGASFLPEAPPATLAVGLGVGLTATIISGGQLALLNGTGNLRALVKSNVWGSVIGTVVTIAAVYASGQAGLIAALAAAPLATLMVSSWFLFREPGVNPLPGLSHCWPELRSMLRLGGVVTLSLLLGVATNLFVRLWLQRSQDLAFVGYFQAAWTITSMYLGFVLTGLAVEYYPRLCKQSTEPRRLNISVDKQIRVALLLGGPVLLWMMVLSPVVLHVLYAPDFQLAAGILRWQLFGDILKIVGWAVGFMLLARKALGALFLIEFSWNLCYLLLALPLASQSGLSALGVAYAGSYAVYVPVNLWLARRETGFILQRWTLTLIVLLLLIGGATLWGMDSASSLGQCTGAILASGVTIASFFTLRHWRETERRSGNEVVNLV